MKHHNQAREHSRPVPAAKKGLNRSLSKRNRLNTRRHHGEHSPEKLEKTKLSRSLAHSDAELDEEQEEFNNENLRHAILVRKKRDKHSEFYWKLSELNERIYDYIDMFYANVPPSFTGTRGKKSKSNPRPRLKRKDTTFLDECVLNTDRHHN